MTREARTSPNDILPKSAIQRAYTPPFTTIRAVQKKEGAAVYPDGQGRSRLTTAVVERKLETSVTARNWNTVRKLLDAAAAIG